jgi:hypothetical protein
MTQSVPSPDLLGQQVCGPDDRTWADVLGQLASPAQRTKGDERRRDDRYLFPRLVCLTPVGEDGVTPEGDSIIAATKDLSEGGLGFYHPLPLASSRMIVSLQMSDGHWMGFLMELCRSRALRQGWYESSGRFLQPALSPLDSL